VWVSSLDGALKGRLSGGEGDWRTVAAADGGRILGVRLEAGKVSQASFIQLWSENGEILSTGPLPYDTKAWSSYAAPVGMDLNPEGTLLAYGYSGYTGIVPNASFFDGFNVTNTDVKVNLKPISQSGYQFPTVVGSRVVAASGSEVKIQSDPAAGLFAQQWASLGLFAPQGYDLGATDVAANGRAAAVELYVDGGPDRIAVVSLESLSPPTGAGQRFDCFLPTVGEARSPSLSQDGTRIAWRDDEGVKVAGLPVNTTCQLSAPAVVISATGKEPSIGGATVTSDDPPGPNPNPPTPQGPGAPVATPPRRVSVASFLRRSGVPVRVRVSGAGRVRITASVPARRVGAKGRKPIVLATGTATARAGGTVTVRLKPSRTARRYKKRLRGATLTLRVTQGARTSTRTLRLR
jgi:hypothetical protein